MSSLLRLFPTTREQNCSRAAFLITMIALVFAMGLPAQAQTFSVIHTFTGADGANSVAGLTIDADGRLYGATQNGGSENSGVVFRLARQGTGWIQTPLYEFKGVYSSDGSAPTARPVFGPTGILYGTTSEGGTSFCEGPGCGTAYTLRPSATACGTVVCRWSESIIHDFDESELATNPGYGDLIFDQAGNAYGTAINNAVFQLTPSNGGWTETTLYNFTGGSDGNFPESGVIFDQAGNLYGTTESGGANHCGTVYELSPNGSGWTEKVLYSFQCAASDGQYPIGGLIFDPTGNLYGTTNFGGANSGGTVFELSPSGGGNWTFHLLYSLAYHGTFDFLLYGPTGTLAMDSSGSLYGTTVMDGAFAAGSVFKLTPTDGGWTYTSLHDFTGGNDGGSSYGNVTFDASGNLYGTASFGGNFADCGGTGCGVVWEITP